MAEHGVKARLTLTNMLADEDDLRDEYLNAMLAIAGRYDAEAIVYADLVGNYVRERYGMRCVPCDPVSAYGGVKIGRASCRERVLRLV